MSEHLNEHIDPAAPASARVADPTPASTSELTEADMEAVSGGTDVIDRIAWKIAEFTDRIGLTHVTCDHD